MKWIVASMLSIGCVVLLTALAVTHAQAPADDWIVGTWKDSGFYQEEWTFMRPDRRDEGGTISGKASVARLARQWQSVSCRYTFTPDEDGLGYLTLIKVEDPNGHSSSSFGHNGRKIWIVSLSGNTLRARRFYMVGYSTDNGVARRELQMEEKLLKGSNAKKR
jgi:hypothetical protein